MSAFQSSSAFGNMPEVVKNLLIINGLFFLATIALKPQGIDLEVYFAAFYWKSILFEPWQIVTHMFMHASFPHIFFNMFALWMFGSAIERIWGGKRFLLYYLVTGFGAFILHYLVVAYQIEQLLPQVSSEMLEVIKTEGAQLVINNRNYTDPVIGKLNGLYNGPVVGASGAVFGILLAFGMMFPNTRLMLLFFPVPIKAKYFVIGYGAIELFSGIANQPGDNVAHFAHLGGMLFGFILIKYWNSNKGNSSYGH
ncbi:rhomboid family intramembrane serine protease [Cryomorphaceae bacterium 1068]|nr:rhomboid family intramembrane serine protease [Cryomorphaceae bacterium 1068]